MQPTPARSFRVSAPLLRSALLALLCIASAAGPAAASISVSPAAVYIDHRTRSATLTLFNPGPLAAEVEIGFAFGYPVSDAQGTVTVPLTSTPAPGEPSATGWLRAFPRRLQLQPGQQQVVRILAQPPAGLADGEYWGRVLVTSRGGQPPVEERRGDVQVQLDFETTIVTSVAYRKGPVATGIEVAAAQAAPSADGVELILDLKRQGTAAYLGRVRAQLVDAGGKTIAEGEDDLAVYYAMRRRILIPATPEQRARGATVQFRIETERPDLPADGPLPAPTVRGAAPLAAGR